MWKFPWGRWEHFLVVKEDICHRPFRSEEHAGWSKKLKIFPPKSVPCPSAIMYCSVAPVWRVANISVGICSPCQKHWRPSGSSTVRFFLSMSHVCCSPSKSKRFGSVVPGRRGLWRCFCCFLKPFNLWQQWDRLLGCSQQSVSWRSSTWPFRSITLRIELPNNC